VAERPFDLWVTGVSDQDDLTLVSLVSFDFAMNFRDQGANGIISDQTPLFGVSGNFRRYSVRREQDDPSARHLAEFLDKYGALRLEASDNRQIVDDRAAHEDGCTVLGQGAANGIDRAAHAGAKSARRCEDDANFRPVIDRTRLTVID